MHNFIILRMQRGQLKDISSWMARLLPEPFDTFQKTDSLKMFSSKMSSTSTSTFYTDLEVTGNDEITTLDEFKKGNNNNSSRNSQLLEIQSATSEDGNSQDSDSAVINYDQQQQQKQYQHENGEDQQNQQQYTNHSFHRISSFGEFERFQPFVMPATTQSSDQCTNISKRIEETSTSIVQMTHSVIEYRSSR